MAFKTVTDLNADETVSLGGTNKKTGKKNPSQVEGYYLGKKEVEDRKKKSGRSYIYILQTPKGNLGVWGKTDMDRKMLSAVPGTMLRITHVGFTNTPNGEMYKYKVEFDEDNTIEVTGLETSSGDSDYDDSEAESEDLGTEDEETEDQVQASALSALERKSQVESLLRKNKR